MRLARTRQRTLPEINTSIFLHDSADMSQTLSRGPLKMEQRETRIALRTSDGKRHFKNFWPAKAKSSPWLWLRSCEHVASNESDMMSRKIKEFVEVEDYKSLDGLIDVLTTIRA